MKEKWQNLETGKELGEIRFIEKQRIVQNKKLFEKENVDKQYMRMSTK